MKKLILTLFIFLFFEIPICSQNFDLINPSKNIGTKNWSIVNDDVMGGISKSYVLINDSKHLIFKGYLSLENNGGFASSRMDIRKKNLNGVKFFEIKFKGDGNNYKLRFRQKNMRVSYSCDFKSQKNEWTIVKLPVESFKATWRGYTYSDYPALNLDKINSLSLHISDKQQGEFNLEIEYIQAIK
ncbi:MAG: CIA30 family protein [Flavobacteriaceae bacterium]|nr:CIA30 family protein [Flavobacteriaceae bacterium]|tara:strand:+ start:18872 stop:19426 length:555 start_codon:yes stop_codon:yes gene_type:complete